MKKRIISIFILFILIIPNFVIGSESLYVWSESTNTEEVNAEPKDNFLNLESESAILIEQKTGKVLYEKNSHEKLRPASVTKVMSLLLIMENLDSRKNFFN